MYISDIIKHIETHEYRDDSGLFIDTEEFAELKERAKLEDAIKTLADHINPVKHKTKTMTWQDRVGIIREKRDER